MRDAVIDVKVAGHAEYICVGTTKKFKVGQRLHTLRVREYRNAKATYPCGRVILELFRVTAAKTLDGTSVIKTIRM